MEAGNVYKVEITKTCRKQIERSPRHIQNAVEKAITKIAANPCSQTGIKALTGEWDGFYRYRLGNYRIIYQVNNDIVTVILVAFGSRGDIYK